MSTHAATFVPAQPTRLVSVGAMKRASGGTRYRAGDLVTADGGRSPDQSAERSR